MVGFLNGLWVSLLPEAWRKSWLSGLVANVNSGTLITGALQMLICLALLGWRYPAFVRSQFTPGVTTAVLAAGERGGETAMMGLGPLLLVAYLIQPLSLLLLYFLVEGVLRGVSIVVSHEPLPTLPLFLASLADARARAYRRERQLGPRVLDTVQLEGAADLLIASCRPKSWNQMTTIRYQDQLYELVKTNQGAKPRPFLYLLRRIPAHKLVRGVHDYSPDEALTEKERAALAARAGGRSW
jgi:hypothetical protein